MKKRFLLRIICCFCACLLAFSSYQKQAQALAIPASTAAAASYVTAAKSALLTGGAQNAIVPFTRVATGVGAAATVKTGAVSLLGIASGAVIVGGLLYGGYKLYQHYYSSEVAEQLKELALDRYNQANPDPSLDPTQQIPGTVLAFYRNGSFDSYISRAAFNFNINSQGDMRIIYYNSSSNRSTSCSGSGFNGSLTQSSSTPYSFTRVSCSTGDPVSPNSPTEFDLLTPQQKEQALNLLTPSELLTPLTPGQLDLDFPPDSLTTFDQPLFTDQGEPINGVDTGQAQINEGDPTDDDQPIPTQNPETQCQPRYEEVPNFFDFALTTLSLKFPFDIIGDGFNTASQTCLSFTIKGRLIELCQLSQILAKLKWFLSFGIIYRVILSLG